MPVGLIMALTWWEECHDRPCWKAIIEALLQFKFSPKPKVACIGVGLSEYRYQHVVMWKISQRMSVTVCRWVAILR